MAEMLRRYASPRVGGRVDEQVVVTHVVREAVEDQRLVEDLIQGASNLVRIHLLSMYEDGLHRTLVAA